MANLTVAILGLDRFGASVGLALKRYMANDGRNQFEVVGHDFSPEIEKRALKMGAVDRTERRPYTAVAGADLVVMSLPFDEVKPAYQAIVDDLRSGVVILDASPWKAPVLKEVSAMLKPEHHVVGITPILNPKFLFQPIDHVDHAAEDLFDQAPFLLTPDPTCAKDAVDLAFNFANILGSKPRFLDPVDHDVMLTFTEALPAVLGISLYHTLSQRTDWEDLQWLTNPAFGALTRPLHDQHPDALRDTLMTNRDMLIRAIDAQLETLQSLRGRLAAGDRDAVEALLVGASESYEKWINRRVKADWDNTDSPQGEAPGGIMGSLLGSAIARRLSGKQNDS